MTNNSKGAFEHDAFEPSNDGRERLNAQDTSPLRVFFTIQYTDFGMERLYGELAALKTDLERMRHVKRCLLDIVRGDFHRAPLALPDLGDCDRESFKLHVRLSTRDTGLESLYQELKPLATVFRLRDGERAWFLAARCRLVAARLTDAGPGQPGLEARSGQIWPRILRSSHPGFAM